MSNHLRITRVGWTVSAVFAVLYVLITVASLFLVRMVTTGSLTAALLGLSWRTLTGFELGFMGVLILSFGIASVFVLAYNSARRMLPNSSRKVRGPDVSAIPAGPAWAIRVVAGCMLLPVVVLAVLKQLAPFMSSDDDRDPENTQSPSAQILPINLGSTINSAMREAEPAFTADGQMMYFNCYNGDICVSRLVGPWEDGNWTPPERLGPSISSEYREIEPFINATGDKLYFTSRRPPGFLRDAPFLSPFVDVAEVINMLATAKLGRPFFGGLGLPDVWVSHLVDGAWSEPLNINDVPGEPPINTPYADHCIFFSADGNEVFWTSSRPGGHGGNDIWTSRRIDGRWSEAENLGSNVNGPGSDHTSIPTPDGLGLYVTSERAGGYGGEDIYLAVRGVDGQWSPLVNIGAPVNGPGDDRCPAWTPDMRIFLFDSIRAGGLGSRDIWWTPFQDIQGYPEAS